MGYRVSGEFSKGKTQMSKKCLASSVIRGIQTKNTLRFHLFSDWPRSIKQMTAYAGEEPSSAAGRSAGWYSHYENHCGGFSERTHCTLSSCDK